MLEAASEADYLIVGSELLASTLHDETHWLNAAPKEILNAANTDRIAILCTGLPYQADRFIEYDCFLLYNYTGMNEADIGATAYTGFYGPAIPAGIEAIFGG